VIGASATRRSALATIALAAAAVLGDAARAADPPSKAEFPQKVRLTSGKDKRERSFHYALPAGVTAVDAPKILTAKIVEKDLLFADIDGNGRFGDVGVDGWIVDSPVYRAFLPIEDSIVLDRTRVTLRFAEDGPFLQFRLETPDLPAVPEGLSAPEAAAARGRIHDLEMALETWNRLRLRAGLPPAFLDPDLTRAAMLHAQYMDRWGMGHDEDATKDGHTAEGAKAGKSSSVGPAPAKDEISFCYGSLYHRLMLFHPDLRRVGIGVGEKFCALDGLSAREPRPWTWPVLIPSAGNDVVPLGFSGEKPAPHPDVLTSLERQYEAGFPITLTFPDTKVTGVDAELRVGGPEGALVEALVSSPEKPANPAQPANFRSICIIPLHHLTPATTYSVRVRYKWDGKDGVRRWLFRTIAPAGPR
jgi:hypothetical protein